MPTKQKVDVSLDIGLTDDLKKAGVNNLSELINGLLHSELARLKGENAPAKQFFTIKSEVDVDKYVEEISKYNPLSAYLQSLAKKRLMSELELSGAFIIHKDTGLHELFKEDDSDDSQP